MQPPQSLQPLTDVELRSLLEGLTFRKVAEDTFENQYVQKLVDEGEYQFEDFKRLATTSIRWNR